MIKKGDDEYVVVVSGAKDTGKIAICIKKIFLALCLQYFVYSYATQVFLAIIGQLMD